MLPETLHARATRLAEEAANYASAEMNDGGKGWEGMNYAQRAGLVATVITYLCIEKVIEKDAARAAAAEAETAQ